MDTKGWCLIPPSFLHQSDLLILLQEASIDTLLCLNSQYIYSLSSLCSLSQCRRIAAKNQEWCPLATVHTSTNPWLLLNCVVT